MAWLGTIRADTLAQAWVVSRRWTMCRPQARHTVALSLGVTPQTPQPLLLRGGVGVRRAHVIGACFETRDVGALVARSALWGRGVTALETEPAITELGAK